MNNQMQEMLKRYNVETQEDKKNALNEIIQELVLCGLAKTDFFEKAAFYGGTALRIFYGLDRFSEDLDFSLKEKDDTFDFVKYMPLVEKEILSFGIKADISEKEKTAESHIKSAFLKANTKEHLLLLYPEDEDIKKIVDNELIKIKIKLDVFPPKGATFETKYRLVPSPYSINMYDESSLFAGKIHAILCRAWKNRVKGRDLYDYIFFLSRNIKCNILHLKERFKESGKISDSDTLDNNAIKEMLIYKFSNLDYNVAVDDVKNFLKDKNSLELWNKEFFTGITKDYIFS